MVLEEDLDAKTCDDCNSTTDSICDSRSGYVLCSCKSGMVGNGWNCTIMAFCDRYVCCPDGYSWDAQQKQCVDIDECASSTLNKCSPTDTCVNKNGNYLCVANKSAPCGGASNCTSDQDCLSISGAAQCADPCYNYQQINGTNRLATINSTGRFPTDRNLFGWFRYIGNGLSLKEGCVEPLKCGSLEPFTLGGSHPNILDGIKTVPLLINSVASGCYTGGNILVKACPGGYYVYKFSGTLKYDVYCTGDSSCSLHTTTSSSSSSLHTTTSSSSSLHTTTSSSCSLHTTTSSSSSSLHTTTSSSSSLSCDIQSTSNITKYYYPNCYNYNHILSISY
ncbi:uromodulin-like [Hyperolius riggenbachi]|uniref:uromodulin-like n=1 Tax=Hyperolius riggenbachi TaxID=752182 RepID=UPI0035A3C872